MRLINASSLQLVNKREDELPPYAILSHTWDRDEHEVSFEDMQAFGTSYMSNIPYLHHVARKIGFTKIRECARLALSHSLQYIWVDTCCINKSSSAELSEAINSMYRWYQGSAVCFALLSDVSVQPNDYGNSIMWNGVPIPTYDDYSQAVRSSRWFTRGWTLQELVASPTVQFYSRDWSFLGDKSDPTWFQGLISSITGIPVAVLDGSRSVNSLGIAERMHWASGRVTTRIEDQAYSLMGIFDVNMPLLYGEGKKAFIRLQEEIIKASSDQSLFAWRIADGEVEPPSGLTGLLAPSPACFKTTGHIVPLTPDNMSASTPSAMTNIGLQITLELSPMSNSEPGEVNAILDCASYTPDDMHATHASRVAIRLTALGGNQRKQVFVQQQPVPLTPDVVLHGLETILAYSGRLISVWPHGQWDDMKQTVRSRRASCDGITTPDVFETYFSKLLVRACINNDTRAARELLKSRLSTALANVWTSEVRIHINNFDKLNVLKGFRPLHWAALFGYEELVEILLDYGANPFLNTWAGLTPIHVAIVLGHTEVLERIFTAEITRKRAVSGMWSTCDTLLNFAASYIRTEQVLTVLDSLIMILDSDDLQSPFARLSALGETLLHRAAAMDNVHAAGWAITRNAELIECRDKRGRTPLFHAAASGSLDVCRLLLDNGAKMDVKDEFERTPLCAACRHGHLPVAELLLTHENSSYTSRRTSEDHSGFQFNTWHFAALSGNAHLLRLLGAYTKDVGVPGTDLLRVKEACCYEPEKRGTAEDKGRKVKLLTPWEQPKVFKKVSIKDQ
ncbi:hypothetical protein E8E13_005239 [Curvularia kusanoi]|uniref:Heterokaryon incompatibility domain-containing protein n=1 Tax=Curvularia kusanoi TaxID=90978 RepID=A0A9P4WAV4_CURKU|nr:hypothetical protein E8E13_005239 [Curvularia kusanoi]